MSLRQFHILFINISILLGGYFAFWNFSQFQIQNGNVYLLSSIVSVFSVIALIIYEINFLKKTKE